MEMNVVGYGKAGWETPRPTGATVELHDDDGAFEGQGRRPRRVIAFRRETSDAV